MELLGKVTDAASMLWQSLDERERSLVLAGAGWLLVIALVAAQRRSRDRLRRDILEELAADGATRP